jgi:hypothetical protein
VDNAGSHEAGGSNGDQRPEGVDRDIDGRCMAAADDALVELVRDRVEDRKSQRPTPRRVSRRRRGHSAPEEKRQDAEHSGVADFSNHEIEEIIRNEAQVRLGRQREHQPGPGDDRCPGRDRPGGATQRAPDPLDHPDRIRAADARTDASPSATLRS